VPVVFGTTAVKSIAVTVVPVAEPTALCVRTKALVESMLIAISVVAPGIVMPPTGVMTNVR